MIDRTPSTASWNLATAVAACTILEQIAPNFGMHVGLTGGASTRTVTARIST